MQSVVVGALLAAWLAILPAGCGGRSGDKEDEVLSSENSASVVLDADALMTEWRELAKTPKENLSNPRCRLIGMALAVLGAEALEPLFIVLEDPQADPVKKVLVVATLEGALKPDMLARLGPLTDIHQESTTRACAMELLALLRNPAAEPYFRAHLADPDKRVRLVATVGLASLGDAEARRGIVQLYSDQATTVNERERILREIAAAPTSEDNAILAAGLADQRCSLFTRITCAQALGRVGDRSILENVRKYAQEDASEELRKAAQEAADAIEAHHPIP